MSFTADQAYDLVAAAHGRQRLAHAFLISGAKGSGKEALAARIIALLQGPAKSDGFDLFGAPAAPPAPKSLDELEGEWVRIVRPRMKSRVISIDAMRELSDSLQYSAPANTWKVGVIADADRMRTEAANAFLKTLEEPPPATLLLLITERPQFLLPTLISRCVRLPLLGGSGFVEEEDQALVKALNTAAERGLGQATTALYLKSVFAAQVDRCRAEALAAAEAAQKEEEKTYKQVTEGDWLKRREEFHKAGAEAEALAARSRLIDVLQAWLADAVRICSGAQGGLDFPDAAQATAKLAAQQTISQLLRRMDAVETLRQSLNTNTQEQLALEVGFLRIFA